MENVDSVDVVVIPPEPNQVSDEDDGHDENMGLAEVNDIPGTLELHIENLEPLEVDVEETVPADNVGVAGTSGGKKAQKRKLADIAAKWKKTQPTYKNVLHPTESEENKIKKLTENLGTLTPLQLFEKILN
jgi:hypothetical protein